MSPIESTAAVAPSDKKGRVSFALPGSPWENGYRESFNSKLRDEFLNGQIFYSMKEIRALAERWQVHYNTIRPQFSLVYRQPAPRRGWQRAWGMEKWKPLRPSHFFTLPTATIDLSR